VRSLNSFLTLASLTLSAFGTVAVAEQTYMTTVGEPVGVLDVFRDCDACPEMVVLPTGTFTMGSTEQEANDAYRRFFIHSNIDPDQQEVLLRQYYASRNIDPDKDLARSLNSFLNELPAHQVLIDLPIAIGRNEVTRQEWAACVEGGGCAQGLKDIPSAGWLGCMNTVGCVLTPDDRIRFRLPDGPHPTDPRSPMTGLTYHEMTDYTSWLNATVGAIVYRLPTEAEWEYAARAGTTTAFAQGETLSLDQANFMVSRRDTVDGEYVWDYDLGSVRELLPVDRLDAANAWGLRHMSGNASELTSTCGAGSHRSLTTSSQYLGVDMDNLACEHSVKGGMYDGNVELARPARRVAVPQDHWSPWLGFRVVRDLELAIGSAD
jgi:formylglycine-generating enzyme required for sulfatase activity